MAYGSKQFLNIFKLASESEVSNEEDTESVYSMQQHETDLVEDTPDTDTKTESEYEFELQSSEGPDLEKNKQSSTTDEDLITAGTIAAVLCDSSLGAWHTDGETDSSSSEAGLTETTKCPDYWICVRCKQNNNNPRFRFCKSCFQERKANFPARPRKKPRSKSLAINKMAGSSQDSGIASLTESTVKRKTSFGVDQSSDISSRRTSTNKVNCKRKNSSDDIDDATENKRLKLADEVKGPLPEIRELCICCNSSVKNGIFLHGRTAHLCFCYKCALRTWKTNNKCPICNRKVSYVVKVFTS